MPEWTIVGGQRLKPLHHLRIWSCVNQQITGTNRRQILHYLAGTIIRSDCFISRDGGLSVARCELGGLAQAGEQAVARGAVFGEFGKSRGGLLVLASFRERHRLFERGAGRRHLLGLPPLVA